MSKQLEDYKAATDAWRAAQSRADNLASIITEAGLAMQNGDWRSVMVSNIQGGYPIEVGLNPDTFHIDAMKWPTAEQIHEALSGWHQAKGTVHRAYDAIPQDYRDMVQPPGE